MQEIESKTQQTKAVSKNKECKRTNAYFIENAIGGTIKKRSSKKKKLNYSSVKISCVTSHVYIVFQKYIVRLSSVMQGRLWL